MALINGRPDGRSAQYIYADGQGGVVDYRLSAHDMSSPEESAKAWEKVKNGSYRGLEKLVKWLPVLEMTYAESNNSNTYIGYSDIRELNGFSLGSNAGVQLSNSGLHGVSTQHLWGDTNIGYNSVPSVNNYSYLLVGMSSGKTIKGAGGNNGTFMMYRNESPSRIAFYDTSSAAYAGERGTVNVEAAANFIDGEKVIMLMLTETNTSVSGSYTQTDIIGDPSNILQTDALKDGWLGSWIPVIPDGVIDRFPLTRKTLDTGYVDLKFTVDNGGTWTVVSSSGIDNTTNIITLNNWASTSVSIASYTAFAKQTKPSTNKPVLNGETGVGSVTLTGTHDTRGGNLLMEALIGKVGTSNAYDAKGGTVPNLKVSVFPASGKFDLNAPNKHAPIDLSQPENNSQAIKAMPYQISDNGQASIGVQANELTWDAKPITQLTVGGTLPAYSKGDKFAFPHDLDNSALRGKILTMLGEGGSINIPANWYLNYYVTDNGRLQPFALGNSPSPIGVVGEITGWGDDSTMKITASGSDTFVDLNGNTQLSVVHELALPTGWTKNQARAGEQKDGVDL